MGNKGLIFLDTIIGLFIIGLIVVVSFPVLTLINKSFETSQNITEMTYLAESTMENLRKKDEKSIKFLEELERSKELEYLDLDNDKYISHIELVEEEPNLWNLIISISKRDSEGGKEYVEIKASIPK